MRNYLTHIKLYILTFFVGFVSGFFSYVIYVNYINPPDLEPQKIYNGVIPQPKPVKQVKMQNVNAKPQTDKRDVTIENNVKQSDATNTVTTNEPPVNWTEAKAKKHLESFGIPEGATIITDMDDSNLTREEIISNENNIDNAIADLNNTKPGTDAYFDALENYIGTLNNSTSLHHRRLAQFLQNQLSQGAIVTTEQHFESALSDIENK